MHGVLVILHILFDFHVCASRGGAGFDPSWHKSGTGLHKLNSIHDFVSCGKYLVNKGYVHTYKLGAVGDSAGSLLVGAAMNMYPELFRAAILKVNSFWNALLHIQKADSAS